MIRYDLLAELANHLETVDNAHAEAGEPGYDQTLLFHPCGTPACALGHWLALENESWTNSAISTARYEFNLSIQEAIVLFSGHGMGGAKTGKEAAEFIREFIRVESSYE